MWLSFSLRNNQYKEENSKLWENGWHTGIALTSRQCGLGSILAWCHMWVEFVVGSRLALWVFLRFSSLHKKNNNSKFQSDQNRGPAENQLRLCGFLSNYTNLFIYFQKEKVTTKIAVGKEIKPRQIDRVSNTWQRRTNRQHNLQAEDSKLSKIQTPVFTVCYKQIWLFLFFEESIYYIYRESHPLVSTWFSSGS